MTTTAPRAQEARPRRRSMKQTERIEAPMGGPGRGPMGGGMVGQKAMTFGPSAKRLLRRLAPGAQPRVRRGRRSPWSASSCSPTARGCSATPPT